jgi:dihydrolipoamide dehydrogenase
MSESKESKGSVVVIGGGPGGYPAAFYAADHGMDVTLVDTEKNPGGVCVYRGCIPSKALLHIARVLEEAHEAESMGVTFGKPKINVDKLRDWKNSVVSRLTGGTGQLRNHRKIKSIQGRAQFLDAHTLEIEKADGAKEKLSFENAIIATGSRPAVIPALAVDSPHVLDSTSALELEDIPGSMLVIGGGYIGLEMGTVYAALGSKVSVIEMTDGLLPGADRDLVKVLAKRVEKKFESILLSHKVTGLKPQKNGIKVSFEDKDGKGSSNIFDKVLISVGRKPNTEDVGLDKAGVKVSARGFIEVDGQRRTSVPHIFAIGDVTGDPMLAHKASHEGIVAVEALLGKKSVFEPQAIPAVVFTDPEIAWTGITENEASSKGVDVKVSKFPWAASGRAMSLERTEGLTKIIADPKTERILGVGIVGVNAGELIAEGTLAIEMGATAEDLKLTIHAHPTLSETMMEAGEAWYGNAIHSIKRS